MRAQNNKLLSSLLKRLHSLRNNRSPEPVKTPSLTTSVTSKAITPSKILAAEEQGTHTSMILEKLRITQATPVRGATPYRVPNAPKTLARGSNKKKFAVQILTQDFFARGRENAIKRETSSAVKPPVTGPAAGLRNRVVVLPKIDFDSEELDEKEVIEVKPSTSKGKRQPRSVKAPAEIDEIFIDED